MEIQFNAIDRDGDRNLTRTERYLAEQGYQIIHSEHTPTGSSLGLVMEGESLDTLVFVSIRSGTLADIYRTDSAAVKDDLNFFASFADEYWEQVRYEPIATKFDLVTINFFSNGESEIELRESAFQMFENTTKKESRKQYETRSDKRKV